MDMAADRDQQIEAKAAELHAGRMAGWNIGAAKAFLESVGRDASDESYKENNGTYPRANGWPCTSVRGRRVSLAHVNELAGGIAAFCDAGKLD